MKLITNFIANSIEILLILVRKATSKLATTSEPSMRWRRKMNSGRRATRASAGRTRERNANRELRTEITASRKLKTCRFEWNPKSAQSSTMKKEKWKSRKSRRWLLVVTLRGTLVLKWGRRITEPEAQRRIVGVPRQRTRLHVVKKMSRRENRKRFDVSCRRTNILAVSKTPTPSDPRPDSLTPTQAATCPRNRRNHRRDHRRRDLCPNVVRVAWSVRNPARHTKATRVHVPTTTVQRTWKRRRRRRQISLKPKDALTRQSRRRSSARKCTEGRCSSSSKARRQWPSSTTARLAKSTCRDEKRWKRRLASRWRRRRRRKSVDNSQPTCEVSQMPPEAIKWTLNV